MVIVNLTKAIIRYLTSAKFLGKKTMENKDSNRVKTYKRLNMKRTSNISIKIATSSPIHIKHRINFV